MKTTLKQSFISFTLLAGLFLFPSLTFASTVYIQTSSPTFNFEYWVNPTGFVLGTPYLVLGNIFPLGKTFTATDTFRATIAYFDTTPSSQTWGIYDQTTGGGAVCTGTFNTSNFSTYQTITTSCSVIAGSSNPGDILLLRLPGNGAHTSAIFIQTAGGDTNATTSRPYFELTDSTGIFNGNAPSTTPPNGIVSPTVDFLGVTASSTSALCSSLTASSTSILNTIGNDISYGICYPFVFLFIPNQNSVTQFFNFVPNLEQKLPFSYFFDIYNTYSAFNASSTENLPTFSMPFPNLTSSTPLGNIIPTQITFFSTTTISKYYPDNLREGFLTLGSFAIWVSLMVGLYRRIIPHTTTEIV